MKTAYVQVILGLFSGRNITTPESRDRQWEDNEEKILMFTQRTKTVINIPWIQMSENRQE